MVQQILTRCVKEFENDKGSMSYYEAVQRTFDNHPGNVDEVAVLMKFTT